LFFRHGLPDFPPLGKAPGWIWLRRDHQQQEAIVKHLPTTLSLLVFSTLLRFGSGSLYAEETPAPVPVSYDGVIFVANGAGDLRGTSEGFAAAIADAGLHWEVRTVRWAHTVAATGFLDLKDRKNHKTQGKALAAEVAAYRAANPGKMICLAGHSAGCSVVLAAAEALPPGSVDHIVMLAAAVSCQQDLKPALHCVTCAIDVFYSRKDCFLWSLQCFGPPQRFWTTFGGRSGFQPETAVVEDPAFVGKLRQHPWHPDVQWTGHDGGHFGYDQKDYLHYIVFPYLGHSETPHHAP
jgi:hypothetical protein